MLLLMFLIFSKKRKIERGLLYTPAEIAQQPATWESTFSSVSETPHRACGVSVNGGFGDSVGRANCFSHRRRHFRLRGQKSRERPSPLWKCEVLATPSTSLLTHIEEWLIPGQRYLWISFSRSGDSPEGVSVLEKTLASSGHPSHHRVV
jgi:tagatose-6-phosphate ketose/aldose isomerase